ncbi:hypothetical protein GCM10008025_23560 [Ornithinibacillus halotolerans]|uniref:Uncharacterized protein n=1 Tax=Ornithinibacillus halotolerans TaxID=1274357 RepID=A0A916WA40_9BACI|nr:hypothetical protein GCM10008025_23560 [Ornithinibacillus halotolerans]
MPFLLQDKERFVSETSHAEKAFSFFKESPYISGACVVLSRIYYPNLLVSEPWSKYIGSR